MSIWPTTHFLFIIQFKGQLSIYPIIYIHNHLDSLLMSKTMHKPIYFLTFN